MGKKIYITENQLDYIIKNVDRLNEQVVETKTPTYNFGDLFEDNMVTPRRTPEYIAEGKKMLGDINKALSEGKDIKDIKIKIVSRASTDSATKCLPANINTPDHYYGKSKEEIQWKHCPTDADKVANVVEDVKKKASMYSQKVYPYLDVIRDHIDRLELTVDNEIWPLPKYRELLFVQ